MTKAERIYRNTHIDCIAYINYWGFEGLGFSGLTAKDDERICTRTLNEVERLLAKDIERCYRFKELGIIDEKRFAEKMEEYSMVGLTLANARRHEEEFKEMLRA